MLLRDLVRQTWADKGVYAVTDARLQEFLTYVDEHELDCWEELVAEFRKSYYDLFELVVPPLMAVDDTPLRLALIHSLDVRRRQESSLLRTFVGSADPEKHAVELKQARKKLRDPHDGIGGTGMLVIGANQVGSSPAGEPRFTNGVWQEEILDYQIDKGMRVHRFSYPAREHSHWHIHEGEQAIYVESGRGWIKMEGEEGVEVAPGDLVYVPKDKKHWHGATPNHVFVHLAFTASGGTKWEGEVTEEAYQGEFA